MTDNNGSWQDAILDAAEHVSDDGLNVVLSDDVQGDLADTKTASEAIQAAVEFIQPDVADIKTAAEAVQTATEALAAAVDVDNATTDNVVHVVDRAVHVKRLCGNGEGANILSKSAENSDTAYISPIIRFSDFDADPDGLMGFAVRVSTIGSGNTITPSVLLYNALGDALIETVAGTGITANGWYDQLIPTGKKTAPTYALQVQRTVGASAYSLEVYAVYTTYYQLVR